MRSGRYQQGVAMAWSRPSRRAELEEELADERRQYVEQERVRKWLERRQKRLNRQLKRRQPKLWELSDYLARHMAGPIYTDDVVSAIYGKARSERMRQRYRNRLRGLLCRLNKLLHASTRGRRAITSPHPNQLVIGMISGVADRTPTRVQPRETKNDRESKCRKWLFAFLRREGTGPACRVLRSWVQRVWCSPSVTKGSPNTLRNVLTGANSPFVVVRSRVCGPWYVKMKPATFGARADLI
jgi:hypothetical protein